MRASGWEQGMGYAAILVHVDADADSDPRVKLGHELAARCDATLIGAGAWAMHSVGGGDIAGGEDQGSDAADFVGVTDKCAHKSSAADADGLLGEHWREACLTGWCPSVIALGYGRPARP